MGGREKEREIEKEIEAATFDTLISDIKRQFVNIRATNMQNNTFQTEKEYHQDYRQHSYYYDR